MASQRGRRIGIGNWLKDDFVKQNLRENGPRNAPLIDPSVGSDIAATPEFLNDNIGRNRSRLGMRYFDIIEFRTLDVSEPLQPHDYVEEDQHPSSVRNYRGS